jgi:hypothetical protein
MVTVLPIVVVVSSLYMLLGWNAAGFTVASIVVSPVADTVAAAAAAAVAAAVIIDGEIVAAAAVASARDGCSLADLCFCPS